MDEHTLGLLEYQRLLDQVAECAQSEPGVEACQDLQPDRTPDEIRRHWRLVHEARRVVTVEGRPPLGDLCTVKHLLSHLETEGRVLGPLELLLILKVVRTSRMVRVFLLERTEGAPMVADLGRELQVFRDLEQDLERSIGPEGEVLDTASPELARVRRELVGLKANIQTKMTGLMREERTRPALQDEIITQRGERYVIPVKVSLRQAVPGLVHDYSRSGATAYVEPLEMVEDNNRLSFLGRKERQEVERVLARLSAMSAGLGPEIALAEDLLIRLDVLFAVAEWSRRHRTVAPDLVIGGGVNLRNARHPLLAARLAEAGRNVVPVDLSIDPGARVVVVSGVNAGGKTVALKTLGLLVLMAQTGLPLPVEEGSRLDFFDQVTASIGDEQDLDSALSTFSGHVRRLTWILSQATDRSLVLLDELGTGTDPAEGAALALAILDELRERGAFVMTATHYHLLKNWAHLTDGAENAAVRVDTQGRPSYGLAYGSPGISAGLAMARQLGLDSEVVARAESYLDDGQKKTIRLLERLEEERARLAEARAHVETLEEELAAASSRVRQAEAKDKKKRDEEVRHLRTAVEQALARAEREFRQVKRQLKEQSAPVAEARLTHRFRQAKEELRQTVPVVQPLARPLAEVHPGDRVMVLSLGREGRVIDFNTAKKQAELDLDGRLVRTSLADLAQPGRMEKPARAVNPIYNVYSAPPVELNLVGLTVEEALPLVEKTLDQAVLGGVARFAIIHGIGTGRLRQAVRGYLSSEPRVKAFTRGERRAGGEGVTLVELAD